jgi:protein TonB
VRHGSQAGALVGITGGVTGRADDRGAFRPAARIKPAKLRIQSTDGADMKTMSGSYVFAALTGSALLCLSACTSTPVENTKAGPAPAGQSLASYPIIVLPVPVATNERPTFPARMQPRKRGLVNVDCVVNEKGKVIMAVIKDSTDYGFEKVTLDAIEKWEFQPGTRDGVPESMRVIIPVEFIPGS